MHVRNSGIEGIIEGIVLDGPVDDITLLSRLNSY